MKKGHYGEKWLTAFMGSNWEELNKKACDPRKLIEKKIGNRKFTNFWSDWWIGEAPLAFKFNRLFKLETELKATVEDRVRSGTGMWSWRGEIREVRLIASVHLTDKRDVWEFQGGPNNRFEVAWMRKLIADKKQTTTGNSKWCSWVPKKYQILTWRILRNRLATKDNLRKMSFNAGNNECAICSYTMESVNHVFCDCPIAKDIWTKVFTWWGIDWRNQVSAEGILEEMVAYTQYNWEKKIRIVVWVDFLAQLWSNRNDITFNNKRRNAEELFIKGQGDAMLWLENSVSQLLAGDAD
ncbi:hypothetical protein LXL04_017587 [Taraxacum kok-saghyz]